jgi:hypothetical protein
MGYEEQLELVKGSIIASCREKISKYWGTGHFDMWLTIDANYHLTSIYKYEFKQQFSKYIDTDVESILWDAGNNTICALNAFISYKKYCYDHNPDTEEIELDDVLQFIEMFISEQMEDFSDWSDTISMAMFQESPEAEESA